MTDDEARSQAAREILDELREVRDRLARLEELMEKIAIGLGVSP
jgi:DNA anti-recombination protein RmuC